MASDADEFKEELQRLPTLHKIRSDERTQASEQALRLFGPIRDFLQGPVVGVAAALG